MRFALGIYGDTAVLVSEHGQAWPFQYRSLEAYDGMAMPDFRMLTKGLRDLFSHAGSEPGRVRVGMIVRDTPKGQGAARAAMHNGFEMGVWLTPLGSAGCAVDMLDESDVRRHAGPRRQRPAHLAEAAGRSMLGMPAMEAAAA